MIDRQHPRMYEDHVWRYVCFQCGHTVFSERRRTSPACPKCSLSGRFYSGHLGQ